MQAKLAQEIIDCLPKDRTLFTYYKDYYAAYLLQRNLLRNGPSQVADLKKSKLGKLMNKPLFTSLLARCGSGVLRAEDIETLWPQNYESYVLTLGTWGRERVKRYRYYQTSRPGTNLVLQMNFCNRHDQIYRHCIGNDLDLFKFFAHPISDTRSTLAWARIDLDFNTGEALIEEIQNDWLREVEYLADEMKLAIKEKEKAFCYYGLDIYVDRAMTYLQSEINRHKALWSEAMLSAAIKFLVEEIGINTIYYHSFETGAALKHINYSKPPRSLYTKLPRQFCFETVNEGPSFIAGDKQAKRRLKTLKKQQWFRMAA